MASEYEDLQNKRAQRAKLLDSVYPQTKDVSVDDSASIPGQDIGDGKKAEGRNDGSESGGTAPPGGEIDLDSARQQFKALTGQVASAKWSAELIAEKIAKWRKDNAPPAPVGEGAGDQTGPIVDGKTETHDGN